MTVRPIRPQRSTSFQAIRLQARDPDIDWNALIQECLRKLGNPPVHTIWVDLPENHLRRMSWWPLYRLVVVNVSREPDVLQ